MADSPASEHDGAGLAAAVPIVAVLLVVAMLLLAVGGAAAVPPAGCGAAGTAASFGPVTLTAEQMSNAQVIAGTTAAYHGGALPAYAAIIAIAAAQTESGLRNLPGGDLDSAGLFQIRTGLHGHDVATDPVKSTNWFLNELLHVPNWQTIPLTEAAANVERPAQAYRGRYAGAQALATAVVAQLWPAAHTASRSTQGSTSGSTPPTTGATGTNGSNGTGGAGIQGGAAGDPAGPDSSISNNGADLCPTSGSGTAGGTATSTLVCTVGGAGTVATGPGNVAIRVCDAGRGVIVDVTIASQIAAMIAAADSAGLHLTGGGFRSYAEQVQLRKAHCGTSDYDIYSRPARECSPPTARPGTSLHEWGLAVDWTNNGALISSHQSPAWQWLNVNASRFGMSNLPSEPWHWSSNGN